MSEKTAARTVSPRQSRAIASRAAIIAAVEQTVLDEGWEAVTTTHIASRAGIAVGTVYRYFADREALLLAAYDETFFRLVETCHAALEELQADVGAEQAARHLLTVYLDAAEAMPAHAGLLKAMRQLRPLESELSAEPGQIISELVVPFFARFEPAEKIAPLHLQIIGSVLSALVDLYLVSPEGNDRSVLRGELEAHLLFMLRRAA